MKAGLPDQDYVTPGREDEGTSSVRGQSLEQLTDEIFGELGWCPCYTPGGVVQWLADVLESLELMGKWPNESAFNEWREKRDALITSEPVIAFVLYWLDARGLTEHGGSVGGSWTSAKGKELIRRVRQCGEQPDETRD